MSDTSEQHLRWMDEALKQAQLAREKDEVPVGAVIVRDDAALACAHNRTMSLFDPTAHAEILAIRAAAESLGRRRLEDSTLYVTLEPCAMCAGALVQARIRTLVFGALDPKAGAVRSLFQIADDTRLNHRMEVVEGVRAQECGRLLTEYFRDKRSQASSSPPGFLSL